MRCATGPPGSPGCSATTGSDRTAEQARARHDELAGQGVVLAARLVSRAGALRRAAAEVEAAQAQLRRAETLAAQHALTIRADGAVLPAAGLQGLLDDPAVPRALGGLVTAALARYAAVPALLVPPLPPVRLPGPLPAPPGAPAAGVWPPGPPPAGDPALVAGWFAALGPAGQAQVIAAHPERVGGADGVPAWARDPANRALLPLLEARLTAALVRARARAPDRDRGLRCDGLTWSARLRR